MCSICGGTKWDDISIYIWEKSKDRGRDDHGREERTGAWIGNHRATPTTEVSHPIEKQPVGSDPIIVFNGIISNDADLQINEGEADTSVLPRALDFSSLEKFRDSIQNKLIGSYAIAVLFANREIWLATNYKPIWIARDKNEFYFSSLASHFPPQMKPYRVRPYSAQSLTDPLIHFPIERTQSEKALVVCSAGLDSVTVASYICFTNGPENTTLLHFDYGCRATGREVEQIKKISQWLQCGLEIIKMPSFGGSSLLDSTADIAVGKTGAEYAHEWVPARNLLMLSHAVAFAEAKGYGYIYLGTNLEEAGAYPDNEEQFIIDFNDLLYGAVQNGIKINVEAPLGSLMKHEIIPFGMKYHTPYHLTWSCYRNGKKHCGKCGPCFMRKTAFERNGLKDPVKYEK